MSGGGRGEGERGGEGREEGERDDRVSGGGRVEGKGGGGHGDLPLTGYKDVFKVAGPLVITATRLSKALQSRARTLFCLFVCFVVVVFVT